MSEPLDLDAIDHLRFRLHKHITAEEQEATDCHCFEQLDALIAELRKLREEARWIPVTERLPAVAGMYLCADEDGLVEQRYFSDHFLRLRNQRMVAWRPLPAPPEVK